MKYSTRCKRRCVAYMHAIVLKTKRYSKKVTSVALTSVAVLFMVFVLIFSDKISLFAQSTTPHWVEMIPKGPMYYWGTFGSGEDTYIACTVLVPNFDAFTPYVFYQPNTTGLYFSNNTCTTEFDRGNGFKPVTCSSGEIVVGVRDYQHSFQVDEEHVDAQCVAKATVPITGAPSWVVPSNASQSLSGGYKEALCASGKVMTGVRMYGWSFNLDDEHVDAYCAQTSASLVSPHWVEAPNAWSVLSGSYKQAVCPTNEVAIGVRFYERASGIDEEHTDVYCASVAIPTVQLNFQ
ncbi:MAG: hypothetical protein RLZZ308_397 [Candidatus Parcubacteria bacterium]